jgi:hypothetical protein
MGSTGQQGVDGSSRYLLDQKTEQLQGCRVCPMQVFQDKEDRLTFGKGRIPFFRLGFQQSKG